ADGTIYVVDSGFRTADPTQPPQVNVPGKVVKVDPVTGSQTVIAQGGNIAHPYGIAVDSNGKLVVSDMSSFGGQGSILRIDPSNGTQTVLWGPASSNPVVVATTPLACPMGVTIEATGTILATDFRYGFPTTYYGCGNPGIYRVDLVNHTQATV